MAIMACKIAGCESSSSPKAGRGMCLPHYRLDLKARAQLCSINGCEKLAHAKTYCHMHYNRQKTGGSPGTAAAYRKKAGGPCGATDCKREALTMGYCAAHYLQSKKGGGLAPLRDREMNGNCFTCGEPTGGVKPRLFCSRKCKSISHKNNSLRPKGINCVLCGAEVSLLSKTKAGQFRRRDTKMCDKCRVSSKKHGVSPGWLVVRDGTDCKLCGAVVVLELSKPDRMSPSVDHIIPRAYGGTNDAENLQLAHLSCNQIKNDRLDGISSRSARA